MTANGNKIQINDGQFSLISIVKETTIFSQFSTRLQ